MSYPPSHFYPTSDRARPQAPSTSDASEGWTSSSSTSSTPIITTSGGDNNLLITPNLPQSVCLRSVFRTRGLPPHEASAGITYQSSRLGVDQSPSFESDTGMSNGMDCLTCMASWDLREHDYVSAKFPDEAGTCSKNGTGTPKYHSSVPGRQYASTVRKKRNSAMTERNASGSFETVTAALVHPASGSSVIGLLEDIRGAFDDSHLDRDWGISGVSDIAASVKELADEIGVFFNDRDLGIVAPAPLASNDKKEELRERWRQQQYLL
ncbi:hypothetical protein EDD18DRAFT_1361023 [Armillaria luteobubalina]|uniref:Uncharacterized protein n=1 Tax=Armillaria luteobubalina TaxID=153913 RepID=A0AA39PL41_9AGAR|nr:hypothetical protein EDD18DRAFT_1361023 [Armillaria luteobubalina]